MADFLTYQERELNLARVPKSGDRTLRAWSAADELLLRQVNEEGIPKGPIALFHDRFGALAIALAPHPCHTVLILHSQEAALDLNLRKNKVFRGEIQTHTPLEKLPEGLPLALLKIPKSLELFELYLWQISGSLAENGKVLAGFMTRHFTPAFLKIAEKYFQNVQQSRAWKKARLLILESPKGKLEMPKKRSFRFKNHTFQQFSGVFSSGNIDLATRFLIENLHQPKGNRFLDLAAGNGILGWALRQQNPDCELHLLDDAWLAIESAKLNLSGPNTHFHWNHKLDSFPDGHFDHILSNPPFHFGHEIDESIPHGLFRQASRSLKPGGTFQIVANMHLNYIKKLKPLFKKVDRVARNRKFEILLAEK